MLLDFFKPVIHTVSKCKISTVTSPSVKGYICSQLCKVATKITGASETNGTALARDSVLFQVFRPHKSSLSKCSHSRRSIQVRATGTSVAALIH